MLIDCEGHESIPATLVELALEFNPVEPERMQEALHHVHAHHDADRHRGENEEGDEERHNLGDLADTLHVEAGLHRETEENRSEL